ncbi:MAG: cytochrome C [Geobacteraceae bacterium]|nr:cytochrome C [Geobacteraceae bacterium]
MKIGPKDWLFVALIGAVLAVVLSISGEEKTKKVPFDESHQPAYETLRKTGSKIETEKGCEDCHNQATRPLPAAHPPKNRCLFCHKMKRVAP